MPEDNTANQESKKAAVNPFADTFVPTLSDSSTSPAAERGSSRQQLGGTRIGRYHLLERLGSGGFGEVWRAEQREPISRPVAVKIIKPGMDSAEICARFDAERQALALMEHPNIAAVLDAGETEAGRPYFVMELVQGVPLTEYCDTRQLSVVGRLQLFIPVCLAIQHAHQKGILHRDLKPSNILVEESDGVPLPKVIDFGIAKALGQGIAPQFDISLLRTLEGMVIGTPQYMSPEQAGGSRDVDTRSDIYALGAILYELLAGHPPLSREMLAGAGFEEILRLVRSAEIRRPSSCLIPLAPGTAARARLCNTSARRLVETLKGELDWITLKALDKDRECRYRDAGGLAEDLRRYLCNEPVSASPPSRAYRLRKFLRRNKGTVAASAAVSVAMVAGTVTSLWQATLARDAEAAATEGKDSAVAAGKDAAAARDQAEDVLLYLIGSLREQLAGSSNLTVLRDVEARVDQYATGLDHGPLTPARTARRAWIWHNKGLTRETLGDLSAAADCHQTALEMRARLSRETPANLEWSRDHALSLVQNGRMRLAAGQSGEAEVFFTEAIGIFRDLRGKAPSHDADGDLAVACHELGIVCVTRGYHGAAATWFREALDLEEARAEASPEDAQRQRAVAVACGRLCLTFKVEKRFDEALELARRARSLMEEATRAMPESNELARELCAALNNLGIVHRDMGNDGLAEEPSTEALRLTEQLSGKDPENATLRKDLSICHATMGGLCKALGRNEDAERHLAEAAAILSSLGARDPDNSSWQMELAEAWHDLGSLHYGLRGHDRAAGYYENATAVMRELVRRDPENVAWLDRCWSELRNAGAAWQLADNLAKAEPLRREAVAVGETLVRMTPEDSGRKAALSTDLNNLGVILLEIGDIAAAAATILRGLELEEALLAGAPRDLERRHAVSVACHNASVVVERSGDRATARTLADRAVELAEGLEADGEDSGGNLEDFRENLRRLMKE